MRAPHLQRMESSDKWTGRRDVGGSPLPRLRSAQQNPAPEREWPSESPEDREPDGLVQVKREHLAVGMSRVRFVAAGSSRGGRRFQPVDELTLHELIEAVASTLPGAGDVLVVPEMPSPLGLPDFVAVVGAEPWLQKRIAADVTPILSEIECVVLSALSSARPLAIGTLERRIGWTPKDTASVLNRLAKAGAINFTPSGAVIADPAMRPTGRVFALEAKLKEWQRGIQQGRTYRTWANNYVIVLGDVGVVAESRAMTRISEDGGGLYNRSGWLVKPQPRHPSPARRLQGYEHLFAAICSRPTL